MHIDIELGSSRVIATVVDTAGSPVAGVPVNLSGMSSPSSPQSPPAFPGTLTDASGTATIEGVTAGHFLVYGSHTLGNIQSTAIDVGPEADVRVQLTLLGKRNHVFELASSLGLPLAGAYVHLKSDTVMSLQARPTNSMGQVRLSVVDGSRRSSLTVLADSQMLWSGCIAFSDGDRTRVALPPVAAGTLRLTRPHSAQGIPLLISEQGGVFIADDLLRWKRSALTKNGSEDVYEIPGLAAGRYRAILYPGLDISPVVQAACAGAISFDDPSAGSLAPGGVLELKWPAPR